MLKFIVIILCSLFFNSLVRAQDIYNYACKPDIFSSLATFTSECANLSASFAGNCDGDRKHEWSPSSASMVIKATATTLEGINVVWSMCKIYACGHPGVSIGFMGGGYGTVGIRYGTNCPNNSTIPPTIPPTIIASQNNSPVNRCGSIIQTSNQVVGELITLTGLPFYLSHFSNRMSGRIGDYTINIPINSSVVPFNVIGYDLIVKDTQNNIVTEQDFNNGVSQNYKLSWNGFENGVETWATVNRNIVLKAVTISGAIADQSYSLYVGSLKAKKLGLGGWLPSNWHFYDSVAEKIYDGDGNARIVKAVQEGIYKRVASSDGSEVYYFDSIGRIALTRTGLTGAVLYSFGYDQQTEKLLNITDAFNKVTTFKYDTRGNLAQMVSPENIQTNFTVDANGYLKTVTNPKGESYSMTYKDAGGLLASFTKPNGVSTTFSYDGLGNLLTDINSGGQSSTLSKTDQGVNAVSAMGRLTQNNYDPATNTEVEIKPSGLATIYVHAPDVESVTNVVSVTKSNIASDPRFGLQVLNYSQTESTDFGSSITNVENTVNLNDLTNPFSVNTLSKTITEGDSEVVSQYDGLTRTNTVTSKLGRSIATQLDSLERPILEKVGDLAAKKYQYDEGRLSKMSQGDRQISYVYYPQTKILQSIKNSENQVVSFEYDAAQRLKSKTLPDGRVIAYSYDSNGNLTSLTPPGRPVHTQIFGANEKLSSYNPPLLDGVAKVNTTYSYNLDRDLTKIIRPDGKEINFNYGQSSGLLNSISGSFGSISMEYNQEQVSKVTDQNNQSASLGYTGNVVSLMTLKDQNQNSLYVYQRSPLANTNGLVQSETISAGNKNQTINYEYDDDKFLTQAGDLNLEYNLPNGSLKEVNLQNIKEEYSYNQYGEVKSYKASYVEASKSKLIYSYELKRDKIGRITKKSESFGKDEDNRRHHKHFFFCRHHKDDEKNDSDYTYDQAGRLVRVEAEKRADSIYRYDKNSNRVVGVATGVPFAAIYDNQDRLIRFNNMIYSYNANGELLSKSERVRDSYVNTTYSYDLFGGLKQAGKVTYKMDPLQRRSARLVNGVVTNQYAYNPEGQLIAELDAQGNLLKTFIYASKSHVPDYFIDSNNNKYKIITDQLGSVRLVVDTATGTIVEKMNHDEFGKVLTDSNPNYIPFGFAGGIYDSETKLVRFGARDYDPETGRWLSKDPIRFNGGDTNLYGYVIQDPVNLIDPNGESGIIAGAGRPFPIITTSPPKSPNGNVGIWQKIGYINRNIDRINNERQSCPNDKAKQNDLDRQENQIFDQMIDTLTGGNSLNFLGAPQL